MAHKHTHQHRRMSHPAFTIVELLIVIVVIAILAAISIVAYTGIQDKARETAALSLVSQTAKKLTAYQATDTNGLYPDSLTATDLNLTDTDRAKLQYSVNNTTTPPTFCITATEGTLSYYQNTTTQTTPAKGGCNGHGQGGVAAITNLHTNPSAGTNATGYSVSAAGSAGANARVATGGPSGIVNTYYQRSTTSTATSSPITVASTATGSSAIPVSPSTAYTISVYVKTSCAIGSGVRIDITQYDDAGVGTSSSGGTTAATVDNWQRITRTVTTSATTTYLRPSVAFSGPTSCPAVSTFAVTGFMVTQGTTIYNYADGNSSGWAWNGTDNNSSSTGIAL